MIGEVISDQLGSDQSEQDRLKPGPQTPTETEFLTEEELAAQVRHTVKEVRQMTEALELPHLNPTGRKVIYHRSVLHVLRERFEVLPRKGAQDAKI